MRPHVLVVSYHAANRLTPRGARSQAVAEVLARNADVRVIAGRRPVGRRTWWHRARDRSLTELGSRCFIDPLEPWAWRALGRRDLQADLALLIGSPFSTLVVAARALSRRAVPYVVDISDPWPRVPSNGPSTLRDRRGARLERRLWNGASAGIVTTAAQARDVLELVPGLDVLVRPNGYVDVETVPSIRRRDPVDELNIGHFGNLYAPRLAIRPFLRRLAESGRWRRVVFHQYGRDHYGDLRQLPGPMTVRLHDPVPWPDVVRLAATELDIALVLGNKDARQLPSKAIEYLTLPVARVALTRNRSGDALVEYLDGKPGWLTLDVDDPDAATLIWEHVRRNWTPAQLAPPPSESWPYVAEEIAAFVLERLASPADSVSRAERTPGSARSRRPAPTSRTT
jgi:hypothetical protein